MSHVRWLRRTSIYTSVSVEPLHRVTTTGGAIVSRVRLPNAFVTRDHVRLCPAATNP